MRAVLRCAQEELAKRGLDTKWNPLKGKGELVARLQVGLCEGVCVCVGGGVVGELVARLQVRLCDCEGWWVGVRRSACR